ncbi:hypothetical protein BGW80DRAFT_1341862 [Lactifluus volemus]|nr:hypothetical protein BGW80DRAFT_1341862 [Lactifluus volemus]
MSDAGYARISGHPDRSSRPGRCTFPRVAAMQPLQRLLLATWTVAAPRQRRQRGVPRNS